MKITKGKGSPVKASRETESKRTDRDKNIEEAKRGIKCAIDALGKSAIKGDTAAKSVIADLGVILFGLK